ncbi:MAG: hypothetical protein ABJ239_08135 [Erythrobacter sp.]
MTLKALTVCTAAMALALGGFVPAPTSVNIFVSAAEAANGSSRGSRTGTKKRPVKKKTASASRSRANGAKKASRAASGTNAKAGPSRVAGKTSSPKRKKSKSGKRNAGNFTGHAAAAATMNLLAVPNPAPRPGRAANPPRQGAKKAAPAAKRAQAGAKKTQRQAQNKTSKTAANPAGPTRRNSDASSTLTRLPTGGGAVEAVARVERATQAAVRTERRKQGKKSRFYWTGFFGRKKKGS